MVRKEVSEPSRVPSTENRVPDNALERLESKLAFLERANNELSDVVYAQRRELDSVRSQLALLIEQMKALRQESRPWSPEEEKPPHY